MLTSMTVFFVFFLLCVLCSIYFITTEVVSPTAIFQMRARESHTVCVSLDGRDFIRCASEPVSFTDL
jgi:hypothetical protein